MVSIQTAVLKWGMRMAHLLTDSPGKEVDIPAQRKMIEGLGAAPKLGPEYVMEPVLAKGVEAEWIYHRQTPGDKVIMDIHGGGFLLGSIKMQRGMVYNLARASGARCISVGYRLAPEHPYPAGLDDCLAVYRWLLEQGVPAGQIVIVGDSAGGTLALAMMLALKDQGEPLPRAAVLISPCTDIQGTGESVKTKARVEPMLPVSIFSDIQKHYAQHKNLNHPYVSPLYGDLRGLPPMVIHVGTDEILLDDSTRLAEKAHKAGVETELRIWPGMFHVFMSFDMLPESRQAFKEMGAFIRKHLGTQPVGS